MRVHIDNVSFGGNSGPNTFGTRLAERLLLLGHEVNDDDGPMSDVSLVFIEPSGQPLAKRVVQRIDGIWFKPWEYEEKNARIRQMYERADAIVFQSQFDREFLERKWCRGFGAGRPCVVIRNGIELNPVKQLTIAKLAEMRATYDRVFVCSANWHPQKRLETNVRMFEHLRKLHPNSCLIIMGDHPDYRATGPNVFYTGVVGPDVYMQVYAMADWMIHLAWADHCPNVCVEALSQGTPIICSEDGGTKELIGHGAFGIVLREEKPYDYELYDYDNPPHIDVEQVKSLPQKHELDYAGVPNIDIEHTAQEYVAVFKSLLSV